MARRMRVDTVYGLGWSLFAGETLDMAVIFSRHGAPVVHSAFPFTWVAEGKGHRVG